MRRWWLILAAWGMVALPAGADHLPIVLRSYQFDPLVTTPQVPQDLRALAVPAGTPGYYIVQCSGPILDGWKAQIQRAGATVLGYIPEFAFRVRMTPESAPAVSALPFVRWVGQMAPAYKAEQSLLQLQNQVTVRIRLEEGESLDTVAYIVRALGGQVLAKGGADVGLIRATVPAWTIRAIMRLSAVAWVEKWSSPRFFNNVARGIIDVSSLPGAVPGGYDVWKNKGLFGAGQVVCVADTGLDTGNYATLSPDFAGRVIDAFTYTPDASWRDGYGHGTHVAGSVLGNGANSGSVPNAHSYTTSFAGVAPEASLVVQRLGDDQGGFYLPDDLYELFDQAYQSGARIHTNSWGSSMEAGLYNTWAESVDRFEWDHKDMVILFANGNSGVDAVVPSGKVDYGSVGPPATAKNCISVGASESQRAEGNFPWLGYGAPIGQDLQADNPNGLAAFSSRGPCQDGRTKPEVVAPGTWVLSDLSALALPFESYAYYPLYQFVSGTSMSTPLTAGSTALVREYLQEVQARPTPSAALIKATLMNCAFDMTPGQYPSRLDPVTETEVQEIEPRPNNDEGWGRVDVGACVFDKLAERGIWFREGESTRGLFTRDDPGIGTGGLREWWFYVTDQTHPFSVTLVWTDFPGFVGSGRQLVNDLDLEVLAPVYSQQIDKNVMVTYLGSGSRAAIPDDPERDSTNNAEEVTIIRPTEGWHRVRVSGFSVPLGPQPFGLVVSGAMVNSFGISGVVADAEGFGVPGVDILVRGNTGVLRTVKTTVRESVDVPAGSYSIGGLSPGTYTVTPVVRLGAPGFQPQSTTVRLPTADGDATGINFVEQFGFPIDGWVRTPALEGIPNVTVTAQSGSLRATAVTNDSGYFALRSLPAGFWTVSCSRPGWSFEPRSQAGLLASTFFAGATLYFTGGSPYPLYTISGGVTTKTGRQLPGVEFSFSGSFYGAVGSVSSNAGGQYAKGWLRADVYTVTAAKPGFLLYPIVDGGRPATGTDHWNVAVSPWNGVLNWLARDRGLAITSMSIDPAPKVGQASVVSATITNVSAAEETNVTVRATANVVPIGAAQTIASLPGLTSETVSFTWIPSSAITYNVWVTADPIEAEPYVTDNSARLTVTAEP